jgi:transposase-like protein
MQTWIRQDEADRGERGDRQTTAELEALRRLRKENPELRRANEILKAARADSIRLYATKRGERLAILRLVVSPT